MNVSKISHKNIKRHTHERGTIKKLCSFNLTLEAIEKIKSLSSRELISKSGILERLLIPDYGMLFDLFAQEMNFDQVVRTTAYHPKVVSEAWKLWKGGFEGTSKHDLEALRVRERIEETKLEATMVRESTKIQTATIEARAEKFKAEADVRKERVRALTPQRRER